MPDDRPPSLPHLIFSSRAKTRNYTAKGTGGGDPSIFPRARAAHAQHLTHQLAVVKQAQEALKISTELADYSSDAGIIIEIKGEAGLPTESLESHKGGVVLLNLKPITSVAENGETRTGIAATVFVKHGSLSYFEERVRQYASESTANGNPKNQPLVANISSIGLAAIESFWTSRHPIPGAEEETWWEVWVRRGSSEQKRQVHNDAVLSEAGKHEMKVKPTSLLLPEHTIFLIKTTRTKLANAIALLNFVAELRHPTVSAEFFHAQPQWEQALWIDELKGRIQLPPDAAPAVCILDGGVNRGHPLLNQILSVADHDTVDPAWGKDDYHVRYTGDQPRGHGTAMAGLAAYGDLTPILESNETLTFRHRLESVRILPRIGANEPQHYGAITQQGMAIAEANAPTRTRVFCLAVTASDAPDFRETGKPSAWSSSLDAYTSGYLEDGAIRRLVCVSAGNVFIDSAADYPNLNYVSSPEDPAQAWNALTVGAYTEKDVLTDKDGNLVTGWQPLAQRGGLSPRSSTSLLWKAAESRDWPFKPDIVLEGGNCAHDPTGFIDDHSSLALLTTCFDFQNRLFTLSGDTSAATALASRMAAILSAEYPAFWPETVRGLLVHSARWTAKMTEGVNLRTAPKEKVADIVRTYGYGYPDLERALRSTKNRATIICEDSLQPFCKKDGSTATQDMMLYRLPWPQAVLQSLGETEVRLRVTLSYFIEPNPGSRAANSKYRYQSCGLRFRLQSATETLSNFTARISAAVAKEEKAAYKYPDDATDGWVIGPENCSRGSVHSDLWVGNGVSLAAMDHLIVYPVNGWWRLRPQLGRLERRIRYALILSIETDAANVDLYTPIQTAISTPVELAV